MCPCQKSGRVGRGAPGAGREDGVNGGGRGGGVKGGGRGGGGGG